MSRQQWLCIAALAIVSFAAVLPILIKGVPYGYDLPHHYQCAMTYVESIRSGDLYPSWSLNRNFGYGGMETRLYPPVSHYTLALFYLVSGDWHIATWLALLFFTFIGSLGVYLWAQEYVTPWQAAFAGCVFALLPYHLNQIYNTFFYAEYAGTAILPFTFVYLSRVCRRGKLADVIGLGAAFAALILTHLPLTVIGSICFVFYGCSKLKKEALLSQFWKMSAGALLGLAASSFFWVKVIQERDLIAKTLIYADPWLDYSLHFLVTPIVTIDTELKKQIFETATLFYDLMFLCGVVLALSFSLPFLSFAKTKFKSLKGVILIFLLACFLITPASRMFWDRLPLLQETQFPWRWLAIVCITAPVIAAGGLETLTAWYRSSRRPLALIVTGCLIAVLTFSISQIIRPAPYIATADVESRMAEIKADRGFTFWWPIWTRKEALDVTEKVIATGHEVGIITWAATKKEIHLSPGAAGDVRIGVFYHPNWKVTVNDLPTEAKPDENGALTFQAPPGESEVKIAFQETSTTIAAFWLSALCWIFVAFAWFMGLRRAITKGWGKRASGSGKSDPVINLPSQIVGFAGSRYGWLLLVAVSIVTVVPVMFVGFHNGGDLSQHVQFASTFQNSVVSGDLYPGWTLHENMGYGGLGVRLYPPLVPFSWAVLRLLSGDWHTAIWLLFLLLTVACSLGVYFWAKEFLPIPWAIGAGIIFAVMPYHLFEIYNASMYAEFAGCAALSFCFLFVSRVCGRGYLQDLLGLSVSYGLLILTHLPSAVIGSLALLVYSLFLIRTTRVIPTVAKLSASVAVGLMASSIYWVKVVGEQSWMRNTKFWKDDHFDFRTNFLITSPWFDERNLWLFNLVFVLLAFLAAGSVTYLYLKGDEKIGRKLTAALALFIFSMFMSTGLSHPIWDYAPVLHQVQFPWRWLTISSLSGAVLVSAGFRSIWERFSSGRILTVPVKIFALSGLLLFTLSLALISIEYQRSIITSREFDVWVSDRSKMLGDEWFWTTDAAREAFDVKERVLAGDRVVTISSWTPTDREFTVEPGGQANVRVATLFYPNWKARVNGSPVPVELNKDGSILVLVPEERSEIELYFQESAIEKLAKTVSMLTLVFFVCVGFGLIYRHKPLQAYFS